jgi:hypothetical protein
MNSPLLFCKKKNYAEYSTTIVLLVIFKKNNCLPDVVIKKSKVTNEREKEREIEIDR